MGTPFERLDAPKRNMTDILTEHLGEPISVLCVRYWYRGVVREVGADFLVLDPAWAVSVTGAPTASQATTEDRLPGRLIVKTDFIEIVGQFTWTFAGIDQQEEK